MTTERLYSDAIVGVPWDIGVGNRQTGSTVVFDVDGLITHGRFYHVNVNCPATNHPHQYGVWDGVSFLGGVEIDTPPIAGWIEQELDEPIPVVAGKQLTVTACFIQQSHAVNDPPAVSDAVTMHPIDRVGTYLDANGDDPTICSQPTRDTWLPKASMLVDLVFQSGVIEPPPDESKGLTKSRQELMTTLEGAGIRTYYGMGAFAAPCARIFPAEPWVEVSGRYNGRRTQSWEVWVVAGRTDALATFDEIEQMVMAVDAALEPLAAWASPIWRRPAVTDMGGTKYFACRGIIETIAEVH